MATAAAPSTVKVGEVKTRTIIIIAIIILIIVIAIAIYFYQKGKKTTTIAPVPIDRPGDTSGGNNTAGASDGELKQLAVDLFTEMDGFNATRDYIPYDRLLLLSDTDFVNVYNIFNTKYQGSSGETLVEWVAGEKYIWDDRFKTIKQNIASRAGRLGLK